MISDTFTPKHSYAHFTVVVFDRFCCFISPLLLRSTRRLESDHKAVASLITSGSDAKVVKTEEITFKGHKCIYADVIQNGLPNKMYGIDAGKVLYLVIMYPRRYIKVPDAAMERDETMILNSFVFAE